MRFFTSALSLALAACSALAQSQLTLLTYPLPDTTLTAGNLVTVQVGMEEYPGNLDVVAVVIGLAQCTGGKCYPGSTTMGRILYQGPYFPMFYHYTNYTLWIPYDFPAGPASLNVMNLYMFGASNVPSIDYVSEDVTIAAWHWPPE